MIPKPWTMRLAQGIGLPFLPITLIRFGKSYLTSSEPFLIVTLLSSKREWKENLTRGWLLTSKLLWTKELDCYENIVKQVHTLIEGRTKTNATKYTSRYVKPNHRSYNKILLKESSSQPDKFWKTLKNIYPSIK